MSVLTIDQLIRAHREVGLMAGWKEGRSGPNIYSYRRFMDDLNTLLPHGVKNVQQLKDVMTGYRPVPLYWEQPVRALLQLAASGMKHPPTPGPFWHPSPPNKQARQRFAEVLPERMRAHGFDIPRLAKAAEIQERRLQELVLANTPVLPTEIERIAAVFNLTREEFLA